MIYCISFVVLAASNLAMGFSRLVLGVHSANQVLYGVLLGLWTVTWCVYFMRSALFKHVEKIANHELTMSDIKYYMVCVWMINISAYIMQITLFMYNIEKAHSDIHIENIKKCKPDFTDWQLKYENI